MEVTVWKDEEQQLSVILQSVDLSVIVTLVYAKCNSNERQILWDSLVDLVDTYQSPWIIGGDFNVIRHEEEKLRGLPVTINETQEFNQCISMCNMEEPQYKGSKYTWWNGRTDEGCIFKRLDRILGNDKLQSIFQLMEIEHLPRSGSDHAPLFLQCRVEKEQIIKPFRFLNLWLKEESCLEIIRDSWKTELTGDPFIMFHQKLRNTKSALTRWSKNTFGNIFQKLQPWKILSR